MQSVNGSNARIEARRRAELAWGLIADEASTLADQVAYWQRIAELAEEAGAITPAKKAAQIDPFNDALARAFENASMPFGVYKGRRICEIPLSYLCRLCDPSDFIRDVRRYLARPDVQRRIEDE